ncbi:MAG: fibrobacter succinogenes major paralogous domain-containing protein, partial [Bacteroidota bacterium]
MGTAYGNEVGFTTSAAAPSFTCGTSTVSDVDNNTYNTVQIGTQCWTQSNLKVSKYRNGDNIPTGLSNSAWENTTSGAYAIYNNDPVNDGLYGKLYNHYAVTDNRGLCPTGWHVPSDAEWTTLENQLGGSNVAGGALKSTATQPTPGGWNPPNTGATNSSGFNALPSGRRAFNGSIDGMSSNGYWWSTLVTSGSTAQYRYLSYNNSIVVSYNFASASGYSVRCLKNTLPQVNTTSVTNITPYTALVTGEVISDGGDQNTIRGFCYSTISNPTVSNDTTRNGTGLGVYSGILQNLTPSTAYYVRAYATNSVGTSYGNEVSFTTSAAAPSFTCGTSTVSDVDNNTYNTVQIGT